MIKIVKCLFYFLAVIFVCPVLVTVFRSLSFEGQTVTIGQYIELLITDYTVLHYFWNSVLYAGVITAGALLISFPVGFLFAKVRFRGREACFFIYIVVMLLPFQATLLPNYIGLKDLGLLNTPYALMLPMMFSPLAVFLFRQFIAGIPEEVLESALLETNSVLCILRFIVLPQAKEAFLALGVLIFCESWNMVEQVMVFTADRDDLWPLSVMLERVPDNVIYAGAVVYMYPVLVLFLCFRKAFANAMSKFRW